MKPEHVSSHELTTLPGDDLRVLVRDLMDHLGLQVYAWRHDKDGPAFCYEFKPDGKPDGAEAR